MSFKTTPLPIKQFSRIIKICYIFKMFIFKKFFDRAQKNLQMGRSDWGIDFRVNQTIDN